MFDISPMINQPFSTIASIKNAMKLSRVQYKEKGSSNWIDVETMEEDDAIKFIKHEEQKHKDREYRIGKY